MNKEFVPYEIALTMKKLKFNIEIVTCFASYIDLKLSLGYFTSTHCSENAILAPTYSQVFKYFREKYKLSSHVDILSQNHIGDNYYFKITNFADFIDESTTLIKDGYKTYKEAELACINKLIEFVK
jgi:hypothetical protein